SGGGQDGHPGPAGPPQRAPAKDINGFGEGEQRQAHRFFASSPPSPEVTHPNKLPSAGVSLLRAGERSERDTPERPNTVRERHNDRICVAARHWPSAVGRLCVGSRYRCKSRGSRRFLGRLSREPPLGPPPREFGADPTRIHVGGSSAGGHLAAMMLSPGWEPD